MQDLKKLAQEFDLPFYDAITPLKNSSFYQKISLEFLKTHELVPIEEDEDSVTLVMSSASKLEVLDRLVPVIRKSVQGGFCPQELIDAALHELEKREALSSERMLQDLQEEGIVPANKKQIYSQNVLDSTVSGAVIRLVNRMFVQAEQQRATDIHVQAAEKNVLIRFRIDGLLFDWEKLPQESLEAVVSRIKIISGLDIAEKRLPQDGRTTIQLGERQIDVRVSAVPSAFGERIVLRLLDKKNLKLDFEALGFSKELSVQFQNSITFPHGIILVTGPTGSGKTTTLYTALTSLESKSKNIMTVEDPIEYRFDAISQMQVKPEIGLTFAAGLRSLLRQDPDVLMVGEIRDRETAQVAVQAALTGHLVLATLHTNDSLSALTRLKDIGVEPYLIASTVRGVLAQRLVRLLCRNCLGKGCEACRHSGYKGRTGIYEYFEVKEDFKKEIHLGNSEEELLTIALSNGMIPLKEEGFNKVKQGLTTSEEVLRVIQ